MVKLSDEIIQALMESKGEPLSVEVPGSDRRYVVVEESAFDEAQAALESQRNVEAIRIGVKQMEAGLGRPLDEAMDEIRERFLQRSRDAANHN